MSPEPEHEPFVWIIPGDPVAKARPRSELRWRPDPRRFGPAGKCPTCRRGSPFARIYTPTKTGRWEAKAAFYLRTGRVPRSPIAEHVRVEIHAVFTRPQRLFRKKDPAGLMLPEVREDADNVEKAVLDAMKKARVVIDDSLKTVAQTAVHGWYAERDGSPRVVVYVMPTHPAPEHLPS
jgi:Holliday junction resolvase RusA-like endonuclease